MTAEEHAAIVKQLVENCRRSMDHTRNENWNVLCYGGEGRFFASAINYARGVTRNEYPVYRRDKVYPEMKFLKT